MLWGHSVGQFLAPGTERLATQAAIAPDDSSIVFADSVGSELLLLRKRRDASRPEPMAGTEGALSPFCSPDGKWVGDLGYVAGAWLDDGTIVFTGLRQELRRNPADGGASRPIGRPVQKVRDYIAAIESAVHVFDFAADSSRLLVPRAAGAWYSATGHLLYTDRAGGLFAAAFDPVGLRITSGVVPMIEDVVPNRFALSLNGTALYRLAAGSRQTTGLMWVAREERTALWLWRADGTRQELTREAPASWRPSWTSDGRSLAFLANVRGLGDRGNFDIFSMPADGSAPPSLLVHHKFGLWEAELSRDGAWLVARSDEDGGASQIYARHLQGDTAPIPIKAGDIASHLALSPDGRWLAYSALAKGRREVFVRDFPAATSLHIVSQSGGAEPRWSHDGRELFFKGPASMMSVAVADGPTFRIGTPRPLFDLRGYRAARNRQQYDVAPDGRRFLMIREPADADRISVMYVENWFPELEARARSAR